MRRRPFHSVGFLCIRGSTRYGLRATDVEARQNRTLQYLRALIAVNLPELTSSARSTTRASAIASEALSSSSDAGARPMPLAVMARGCDRTCVAAGSAGHDEVAASSASASGYMVIALVSSFGGKLVRAEFWDFCNTIGRRRHRTARSETFISPPLSANLTPLLVRSFGRFPF